MIVEVEHRYFIAEASGTEFADGNHPGTHLEVRIDAGTPANWAIERLRELVRLLEAEGSR